MTDRTQFAALLDRLPNAEIEIVYQLALILAEIAALPVPTEDRRRLARAVVQLAMLAAAR